MSNKVQWKRVQRELTPEQRQRLLQGLATAESENMVEAQTHSDRLMAAASEPTFSGALRRAFHGCIREPGILPQALLRQAQLEWSELQPFLLGEAPLTSDQIDRLAGALGVELVHHDAID
ncbi:MAG TPA: hypothetical protein VFG20_22910 [Planctomycetaceae bacterium]|nr:hypothetical protein [Planctomycetaceae bacterium]